MFPELSVMNGEVTFEEFLQTWEQYQILNRDKFRRGQGLYLLLHMVRPELAKAIIGTDLDPFYQDERIDQSLDFLMQNW
jgi:hypothetical protein